MLKISSLFEAYITNLGKYNEGQLVGETLKFPATTEEVQSLLKNIGVDGVRYEEFFITAFDGEYAKRCFQKLLHRKCIRNRCKNAKKGLTRCFSCVIIYIPRWGFIFFPFPREANNLSSLN